MTILYLAAGLAVFMLFASFVCFYLTFFVPTRKKHAKEEYPIPPGKIYEPYRARMTGWMKELDAMEKQDFSIRSFDGLQLFGTYYEYAPGAPIELMFHGYRGSARRDLCGGVQRCFALGRSALIVDQRAAGRSGGNVITFGIKEHRDCLSWLDFTVSHFGPDVKIILTGISMGASTVLMAAGKGLPRQVIGVLADCGFTSPKAIICKVIRDLHLPPRLVYPMIRLGARLWGGFDLKEYSAIEAVKTCRLPTIFVHGDDDAFVPCSMSAENYNACTSEKALYIAPGAGHGLAFPVDEEAYLAFLKAHDPAR